MAASGRVRLAGCVINFIQHKHMRVKLEGGLLWYNFEILLVRYFNKQQKDNV